MVKALAEAPPPSVGNAAEKILARIAPWFESAKSARGRISTNMLCAGLYITEFLAAEFPLEHAGYAAYSQVRGASGQKAKAILADHGERRRFTSEGGRTSRHTLRHAEHLAAIINVEGESARVGGFATHERTALARLLQEWFVSRVKSEWMAHRENGQEGESAASEALGIEWVNGRLRLLSIQPDGLVRFASSPEQAHTLLYLGGLGRAWAARISELESLINSAETREIDLQRFFEQNPEFLCGDSYEEARPHVILQRENSGPLIPDFALKPRNESALCDLLELKLPNAKVVTESRNRVRLSSAIMEASGQLREYQSYFNDVRNRTDIEEKYGLRFFRPSMMVLIGKRSDYDANRLRDAELDVPYLKIMTYDDVLARARARRRISTFSAPVPPAVGRRDR